MGMMTKNKTKKFRWVILNTSFWRVCAYFIIYSFLGYIVETLFALMNGGALECRQSFLYGPFCGVYGIGSVALILILKSKFSKNNYTLFWGGVLVGSITEYLASMFGEFLLNVKWWDYSNKFLNINGRICLIYSLFWGVLSLYLIKSLNPKIDRFIDKIKSKVNPRLASWSICIGLIVLLIDALMSCLAINYFIIRVSVEKDLNVANKEIVQEYYDVIYEDNPEMADFIYKCWGDKFMLKTYPNLTITLEDGGVVVIRTLYPEIKPYFFKFNEGWVGYT